MLRFFFFILLSMNASGQGLEGVLEYKMDLIEIEEVGDSLLIYKINRDTTIQKKISQAECRLLKKYKREVLSNKDSLDLYAPYQILLKDFEPLQRQLIFIIPDSFHDFPFSSLCTKRTLAHENFKQHPYLLKNHSISCQVSRASWLEMTKASVREGNTVLLVENIENREAPLLVEAKSIRDDFGGLLTNLSDDWRKDVENSRILHLALPIDITSKLKVEEDLLELAPELLSISGETRQQASFQWLTSLKESGTKSVILNHNPYEVQASSSIINQFYKRLFDGDRKHDALQSAQRSYIKKKSNPREAHPYYWAGWKVYGDLKSVNNTVNPYFYLLIIGLLLFFYMLIKRSKVKIY